MSGAHNETVNLSIETTKFLSDEDELETTAEFPPITGMDSAVGSSLPEYDPTVEMPETAERRIPDPVLSAQASRLESGLPAVMRSLFWTDPSHPLAELPLGQFRLCILLFREGRRTMSQVGEDLNISVSAVTQMADRLERVGLVERLSDSGGDRRTRYLQLTASGLELMQERSAMRHARAEAALRLLTPEQRETILDALDTLRTVSRSLGSASGIVQETDPPHS
jgi:MarR family transcriptional regulator, organic hydroperoxide resistance regulator